MARVPNAQCHHLAVDVEQVKGRQAQWVNIIKLADAVAQVAISASVDEAGISQQRAKLSGVVGQLLIWIQACHSSSGGLDGRGIDEKLWKKSL